MQQLQLGITLQGSAVGIPPWTKSPLLWASTMNKEPSATGIPPCTKALCCGHPTMDKEPSTAGIPTMDQSPLLQASHRGPRAHPREKLPCYLQSTAVSFHFVKIQAHRLFFSESGFVNLQHVFSLQDGLEQGSHRAQAGTSRKNANDNQTGNILFSSLLMQQRWSSR